MPALANLTVLKNDGTTNITYTAVQPWAPGSEAIFQAPAGGATSATKPEIRISATKRPDSSYKVKVTAMHPYWSQDSLTGLTTVVRRCMFRGEWSVPEGVTQAIVDEFASQIGNAMSNALLKNCVKEGAAPT